MRYSFMYSVSASQRLDDGVIGYQFATVTPANMQPSAAAELPSMMILPLVAFIRWQRYGTMLLSKFSSANFRPLSSAVLFSVTALAFPLNCLVNSNSILYGSISNRCPTAPT